MPPDNEKLEEVIDEAQSGNNEEKGKRSPKYNLFSSIVIIIVTIINAGIGFWGFDSVKKVSDIQDKVKKKADQVDTILKEVKKKDEIMQRMIESTYYYQSRNLEKEIVDLLKALPSLELRGAKSEKVRKDIERAFRMLNNLQVFIPQEKRAKVIFLVEGFLCFTRLDYEASIKKLNLYDEEIPEKYLLLGQSYRKLNQTRRAEEALSKVASLTRICRADTILAKSFNTRANLEGDNGNYVEALRLYGKALQHDPGLYVVHINRAGAYSRLKSYKDSIEALCKFKKYYEGDIIFEVEHEPNNDFNNLINYLGDNWKTRLKNLLSACQD